jgi:Skp family chaperone for outer membrane proteins
MKKTFYLSILSSVAMITAVKAATLPTPIIGVVEQATLDKSAALKSIVEQMEKKRSDVQKELAKYEEELKKKDKDLAEQQKTLSEKDFAQKRQTFEKRVHEIQQKIELRRIQMELAVEEAKKKVYEAFLKAADEIKTSSGANVIIYKETVVTADPAFDLTKPVLDKLNQTLPTVQVTFKSEEEVKKQVQQQQPAAVPQPQ